MQNRLSVASYYLLSSLVVVVVGYLPCGDEVESVAIELKQAEHELRRVAVRPVGEEGVRRKERQRSIDQRRDRLHAHSERVSTARPNAQLVL